MKTRAQANAAKAEAEKDPLEDLVRLVDYQTNHELCWRVHDAEYTTDGVLYPDYTAEIIEKLKARGRTADAERVAKAHARATDKIRAWINITAIDTALEYFWTLRNIRDGTYKDDRGSDED